MAQVGAKGLELLGKTLEDLLEVETVTMVAMVAKEASKTATKNGDKDAILEVVGVGPLGAVAQGLGVVGNCKGHINM